MTLVEKILEVAKSYIGQEELPGNSGFKNTWFLQKMVKQGWLKFQSWCAYSAKSVWYEAFSECDPVGAKLIMKYANGSSLQTLVNFQKSKEFHVQMTPTPGALVIFREGNSLTNGHEGIVTAVLPDHSFNFSSGNTSAAGSREGTTFLDKNRKLDLPYNPKGLNVAGFVLAERIA